MLASLVELGLAAGRPHVERDVPYARTSIILALDVSGNLALGAATVSVTAQGFRGGGGRAIAGGAGTNLDFRNTAANAAHGPAPRPTEIAVVGGRGVPAGHRVSGASPVEQEPVSETSTAATPVAGTPPAPSTGTSTRRPPPNGSPSPPPSEPRVSSTRVAATGTKPAGPAAGRLPVAGGEVAVGGSTVIAAE